MPITLHSNKLTVNDPSGMAKMSLITYDTQESIDAIRAQIAEGSKLNNDIKAFLNQWDNDTEEIETKLETLTTRIDQVDDTVESIASNLEQRVTVQEGKSNRIKEDLTTAVNNQKTQAETAITKLIGDINTQTQRITDPVTGLNAKIEAGYRTILSYESQFDDYLNDKGDEIQQTKDNVEQYGKDKIDDYVDTELITTLNSAKTTLNNAVTNAINSATTVSAGKNVINMLADNLANKIYLEGDYFLTSIPNDDPDPATTTLNKFIKSYSNNSDQVPTDTDYIQIKLADELKNLYNDLEFNKQLLNNNGTFYLTEWEPFQIGNNGVIQSGNNKMLLYKYRIDIKYFNTIHIHNDYNYYIMEYDKNNIFIGRTGPLSQSSSFTPAENTKYIRITVTHTLINGARPEITNEYKAEINTSYLTFNLINKQLKNNIEEIQGQISVINNQIERINTITIPGINNSITTINETTIPDINNSITTLNETTIPKINNSIIELENNLDFTNYFLTNGIEYKNIPWTSGHIGNSASGIINRYGPDDIPAFALSPFIPLELCKDAILDYSNFQGYLNFFDENKIHLGKDTRKRLEDNASPYRFDENFFNDTVVKNAKYTIISLKNNGTETTPFDFETAKNVKIIKNSLGKQVELLDQKIETNTSTIENNALVIKNHISDPHNCSIKYEGTPFYKINCEYESTGYIYQYTIVNGEKTSEIEKVSRSSNSGYKFSPILKCPKLLGIQIKEIVPRENNADENGVIFLYIGTIDNNGNFQPDIINYKKTESRNGQINLFHIYNNSFIEIPDNQDKYFYFSINEIAANNNSEIIWSDELFPTNNYNYFSFINNGYDKNYNSSNKWRITTTSVNCHSLLLPHDSYYALYAPDDVAFYYYNNADTSKAFEQIQSLDENAQLENYEMGYKNLIFGYVPKVTNVVALTFKSNINLNNIKLYCSKQPTVITSHDAARGSILGQKLIKNSFTPSATCPGSGAKDKLTGALGETLPNTFFSGKTYYGVPYSSRWVDAHSIGFEITMHTFQNAINDPLSIVYNPALERTCGPAYGLVCSSTAALLAGTTYPQTGSGFLYDSNFVNLPKNIADVGEIYTSLPAHGHTIWKDAILDNGYITIEGVTPTVRQNILFTNRDTSISNPNNISLVENKIDYDFVTLVKERQGYNNYNDNTDGEGNYLDFDYTIPGENGGTVRPYKGDKCVYGNWDKDMKIYVRDKANNVEPKLVIQGICATVHCPTNCEITEIYVQHNNDEPETIYFTENPINHDTIISIDTQINNDGTYYLWSNAHTINSDNNSVEIVDQANIKESFRYFNMPEIELYFTNDDVAKFKYSDTTLTEEPNIDYAYCRYRGLPDEWKYLDRMDGNDWKEHPICIVNGHKYPGLADKIVKTGAAISRDTTVSTTETELSQRDSWGRYSCKFQYTKNNEINSVQSLTYNLTIDYSTLPEEHPYKTYLESFIS